MLDQLVPSPETFRKFLALYFHGVLWPKDCPEAWSPQTSLFLRILESGQCLGLVLSCLLWLGLSPTIKGMGALGLCLL